MNLNYADEIGKRKMFRLIHEWCNLRPMPIHVDLTIIKHVFKTIINSERGVPPSPWRVWNKIPHTIGGMPNHGLKTP